MKNPLLVLIVGEAALRSTLAAHLSMRGADIVTASNFRDPVIQRTVRGPATLVVDEAGVAAQPGNWIDAMLDQARWERVVVLTARETEAARDAHERLLFVPADSAATTLSGLLNQWDSAPV